METMDFKLETMDFKMETMDCKNGNYGLDK